MILIEMVRLVSLLAAAITLALAASCDNSASTRPITVRVLREPYFAADLVQVNDYFVLKNLSVHSGRYVSLQTADDVPYWDVFKRTKVFGPDVMIFYSEHSVPDDAAIRNQLGPSQLVCGIHPAFIPKDVSGEQREAAQLYVSFLITHCPAIAVQPETRVDASSPLPPDPHRPACTSARCRKIKKFLTEHYCGESPFGNGPDDGCDYKEPVRRAKLTVDYRCEWNEAQEQSKCVQRGDVSDQSRDILLRELHAAGLPAGVDSKVHFTVVESASGWSLMSADFGRVDGADLILCEVVVAVDQNFNVYILRNVKIQKTNADVPEATTWSPLDIVDINGDGRIELVLKGDAYEDHWLEVIRIENGLPTTIFSGLGYYL